jgi:phage-related minor tail protein
LEEKVLNLIEKMYSEMQQGFKELKDEQKRLGNQMTKIENDLKPKIEAALDGYGVIYEKIGVIENKVAEIAEIVKNHDVAIEVIRRAK